MDKNQIEFAYFKKSSAHFSPPFIATSISLHEENEKFYVVTVIFILFFLSSVDCTCKRYLLLRVITLARLHAMQNVFIIKKINNWSKIYLRYLFADIEHCWYYVWWWLVGLRRVLQQSKEREKYYDTYCECAHRRRGKRKHRFRCHMIGEINKKQSERRKRASSMANAMYGKKKANMRTKWRDQASHSWW